MLSSDVYQGDGFTVESKGLHSLRYSEGNRSATVDGERLAGPDIDYVLYQNTAWWEDGDPTKGTTPDEQSRIVSRVKEALSSWGIRFQVE